MRDYNAIPFRSPKQRQQGSDSGPPSAVSKFVPNMSMDYVKQSNPRNNTSNEQRRPTVRIETPSQRQQRNASDTVSKSRQQPQKQSSPDSSPQSTANTTYTESSQSPPDNAVTEDTIRRLRNALDDAHMEEEESPSQQDEFEEQAAALNAVATSDAVIIELRSTVRQLKRQLEKLHEEKQNLLEQCQQLHQRDVDNASFNDSASAQDARIGEMQVQLDRAHAQILTADMVRKELEDTLEAEQYTWDLRVQDQERMIQQMQDECVTLADELLHCKKQYQQAEEGWSGQVEELNDRLDKAMQEVLHWKNMQMEDNQDIAELKERLLELEQERSDLQSCLDEALKELEAVDAELQNDRGLEEFRLENERLRGLVEEGDEEIMESLRHLYRWLLERDGAEESRHNAPRDAKELVAAIKSHLERTPASDRDLLETRKQVENLESQLSVYRGDLKAREEGSNELRQSLKEAVALLKPLQDAVAKADQEKLALQQELDEVRATQNEDDDNRGVIAQLKEQLQSKDDECNRLQEETESLTIQLSKAKVAAASSLVSAQKMHDAESPSLSKAREGLRAKRQMLADAQNRFSSLRSPNREVPTPTSNNHVDLQRDSEELETLKQKHEKVLDDFHRCESQLHDMQNELKVLRGDLAGKDVEIRELEIALADATSNNREKDAAAIQQAQIRIHDLESTHKTLLDELSVKKGSEKKLNKSLKEALSLLKPLQQHLEEAEAEKKELWDEVVTLRARGHGGSSSHGSTRKVSHIRALEGTIRQLENENARLHDALEDMSQTVSQSHLSGHTSTSKTESRMREDFVELKSRYEVTQGRLEDAHVENHAMMDEIRSLHEQLAQTQAALQNAANALTGRDERRDEDSKNGRFEDSYFRRPRYHESGTGKVATASTANIRRLT